MRALLLTVLMVTSTVAAAEPAKPVPASHALQEQRQAVVMFASNETARPAAAEAIQRGQTPANHRIARVTTCRCGDPQPDSDTESEEQ